jgi:hypothetical protein
VIKERSFLGQSDNCVLSGDGILMPARKRQPTPDLRYFK